MPTPAPPPIETATAIKEAPGQRTAAELAAKRRGRSALRIDAAGTNAPTPGAGLNS